MSSLSEPLPAVPFALPSIDAEEEQAVLRVLRSKWLTTGSEALFFEKEFAAFIDPDGTKGIVALCVNSATSGLHLALEAVGVSAGDVVLTSPYTFASTAEVARYLGAEVAFVDIAPGSCLIDADRLEATVDRLSRGLTAYPTGGPRGTPRVVLPVHVAGLPCDMKRINEIARRFSLKVVEDAAHSFPSFVEGQGYAGTLGDLGVYSFYATKTITTGEGGMVVTADRELARRISLMRLHGIDRTVWNRYTDQKASWRYAIVESGYKYNLPDLLAAIGRVQLSKARRFLSERARIAECYNEAFAGDGRFSLPPTAPSNAWHLYPLCLADSLDRDRFIEDLQGAGIGVSVHFIPLHTMPYYRDRYGLSEGDFPHAFKRFSHSVSLPIWAGMSEREVDRVIRAVFAAAEGQK